MVTLFALELPEMMFPKLKLEGVAEMAALDAVPAPARVTVAGELGALLAIVTLPFTLPGVIGANITLNVAVFPAAIVAGVFNPLAL